MKRTDLITELNDKYAFHMATANEYFNKWTAYGKPSDKESEMMHTGSAFALLGMVSKINALTDI